MSDIFSGIYTQILEILAGVLPTSSGLPADMQTALELVFGYIGYFNLLFPLSTMFSVITVILTFETGIFLFHFVKMIFNFLRGSGA